MGLICPTTNNSQQRRVKRKCLIRFIVNRKDVLLIRSIWVDETSQTGRRIIAEEAIFIFLEYRWGLKHNAIKARFQRLISVPSSHVRCINVWQMAKYFEIFWEWTEQNKWKSEHLHMTIKWPNCPYRWTINQSTVCEIRKRTKVISEGGGVPGLPGHPGSDTNIAVY